MIAVMSLWTEPTRVDLSRAGLLICTASLNYTRRAFPITELVTDIKGIQIADALGWRCTSFSLGLEKAIPAQLHHIWSLGKVEAQRIQTKPHVHIDLDFCLYKPLPDRVMNARVAVQSKDCPSYYWSKATQEVMKLCEVPHHILAYNTAIMLWNDLGFRREYCLEVMHRARMYGDKHKNGTVLAIVLEQAVLGEMTRENGIEVEECMGIPRFAKVSDTPDVSFTHYWSHSKRELQWIELCERRFAKDFPEEFSRFNRGIEMLQERKFLTAYNG